MNVVHLHTHSDNSLLDGLAKVDNLVAKAKKLGMPALALTDHGVMYGAIKFYKACEKAGIKPIIGCEVYVAPRSLNDKEGRIDAKPYHLTLLAKNKIGYKNLLKIVSQAHLKGFYYKPRTDLNYLKAHGEGIICLSGCPAAQIPRAIQNNDMDGARELVKTYMDIFGEENFFFEIQPHKLEITQQTNKGIIQLAKEFNRPLTVANDIHYLDKEDEDAHEVLLAVNTGKDMDDSERMSLKEASLYMMTAQEILEAMPEHKDAIEQTVKIAEMVDLKLEFGKSILPAFPLPEGETDMSYLKKLSSIGFKERYGSEPDFNSTGDPQKDPSARLKYELDVIGKTGFGSYFLIVSDFVTWAKNEGIGVGPGRGSAAGSIVAYCMNITELEPLQFDLLFERFLNPDRIAMPDIDLDFADDRRGEVIEHIKATYGDDHVAQIVTFGVMKARSASRDVARSLGYPYEIGDKIAKLIPMGLTLTDALKAVKELKGLYDSDPQIKHVIDMSLKLEGVHRHASTHAAGVLISKDPLVEYVPLQRSTSGDGEGATAQYDMVDIESIGLLKVDILGLKNLTIIKNALRIIKKTEGVQLDIKNLPLDDLKTYELLSRGETIGVFQLESDGMRRYIKELKPTKIDDIMAMVALYRPGPMEFIPDFIKGKHGKKKISYLHPKLEPILSNTYGIAVYQEQILQMARSIANFSYGEADILRKAIGKKNKVLLQEQRTKFVERSIENGLDKKLAEKLFDFAEPFARYGFNRAHAASYGLVAYQTAYLKAHYPEAFLAALLTSEHKDLDQIAVIINEADRIGNKVLPPDINQSFVEFGVVKAKDESGKEKKVIRFGLGTVKNVGEKASQLIVDERVRNGPFSSFEDLLLRIGGQVFNKKVIESLAKAGALDSLIPRNKVLAGLDEIIKFAQNANKQKSQAQADLFGATIKVDIGKLILPDVPESSKKQRLAWEKEFLGIYLSDHPLKDTSLNLDKIATPIGKITEKDNDKTFRIAGIIIAARKINTKKNQPMAFVQIEDLSGSTEVVVFPGVLEKNMAIWESTSPIVIDGRVSLKDGAIKILASQAYEIDQQLPPLVQQEAPKYGNGNRNYANNTFNVDASVKPKSKVLTIVIPLGSKKSQLEDLKNILVDYPGTLPVKLIIQKEDGYQTVSTKATVEPSSELNDKIRQVFGAQSIDQVEV
jgi:DNA polymerase-3 subunit alpha